MVLADNGVSKAYSIELEDAVLSVCHVTLHPAVILAHEKFLKENSNALYLYYRSELLRYTVPSNQFTATIESPFNGEIPKVVYVMFVGEDAYNGSYIKSPFNFKHYDLSEASITVDGLPFPTRGLHLDFDNDLYTEAHNALLDTIKRHEGNPDPVIDRKMFKEGYTILAFDLSSVLGSEDIFFTPKRKGHLRINLRFNKKTPENINVLVVAKFPDLVQIDASRNCLKD